MMRQFIFPLLLLAMLGSCADHNPVVKESKFASLVAKYKEISIDTFRIYSTFDILSDTFKFKGSLIDTTIIKLFPKQLLYNFQFEKEYYACFKFFIDASRTGLVTRTPGEYTSSSIKLLVFDNQKDSIIDFFELADNWMDAEDDRIKVSWVFKDADQSVKIFMWENNTSIADEPNAKKITSTQYYLIDLLKNKHDTIQIYNGGMLNNFILK